jgi:hypothetical protein
VDGAADFLDLRFPSCRHAVDGARLKSVAKVRDHARSRRIASRLASFTVAVLGMLAQIVSYGHPDFDSDDDAEQVELIGFRAPPDTTIQEVPKSRPCCDADDDADDTSDDDCAPPHVFVRTQVASAQLPFAERITTQVGPPQSIELILVAPKNSPPTA